MGDNRPTLFLSHASADDAFVRQLQQALEDPGQPAWIDSRELRGGDLLESTIFAAVDAAGAIRSWSARLRCNRDG